MSRVGHWSACSQLIEASAILRRIPLRVHVALIVIGFFIVAAIAPSLLQTHDPLAIDLTAPLQAPSFAHWFGTDQSGRDIYSRIVEGAGQSLTIGLGATALSIGVGLVFGIIAGLVGGALDNVLSRLLDVLFALPTLFLALLFVSLFGPSVLTLVIAVGVGTAPGYARMIRGQVLSVKGAPYVEAAKALGHPYPRILWRHIIPNAMSPLTAMMTLEAAVKARQLPHQLSGGQRQRALIAAALALDPRILIADEPTTALDVTVQAQVLGLLEEAKLRGKALLLISHDLAVVSRIADEVLVMHEGKVVERGSADQVFQDPQHTYTRQLLDAVPSARLRGSRLSRLPTARAWKPPLRSQEQSPSTFPSVVLSAAHLVKRFKGPDGVLRTAVDGISFELRSGETLGVVGESGSGKSTMARLALALDPPDEGAVLFQGRAWTTLTERDRRARRRAISVIYQDPLSSFDPRWSVGHIISDSLASDVESRDERYERVVELLDLVGLSPALLDRRPLELSGGQRQRVAIARAIAPRPAVIVCDEPVSALDVLIQAQVLDLLTDLKAHLNMSYIFISHDLGVIRQLSDRVMVMRQGRVVETGTRDEIFLNPRTDYTQRLLAAVPSLARGGVANLSFSRV